MNFEQELKHIISDICSDPLDEKWAIRSILDLAKKTALEWLPKKGSMKDRIVNYPPELKNNPDELYHYVRNQTISQAETTLKEGFK
jgi:hypothetical protein